MKRILTLSTLFTATICFSQNIEIPRCMSTHYIDYVEQQHPGYSATVEQAFQEARTLEQKSLGPHTIPVVVHIVHNNAAQNIHDSVVYNQIAILNENFNRLNADTINMRSDFDPVKGNPQVQFILAQIDPLGNPTNGITRTATSTTSFGSLALIGGDFSDLEKVKSTADGGHDPWDQSRYLNIWVCNMSVNFFGNEITALLGYATPPSGLPNWPPGSTAGMSDGVVIQYQAFGSNNPNPLDPGSGPIEVLGKTTVHEVGHYLGLRHIWGDGDCTAQDGIDDTPNADAQSSSDCDTTKNTCVDTILGIDLPDMVENYMDYSAENCQNTFTAGQALLINGVLELQRYDLVHGNPAAVETLEALQVQVYPNPANDVIFIKHSNQLQEITMFDLSGKVLLSKTISGNESELNISSLNSGVYLLTFSADNKSMTKRIIKL